MRLLIFTLLFSGLLHAQITLRVNEATYTVTGTETLSIMNSYAQGYNAGLTSATSTRSVVDNLFTLEGLISPIVWSRNLSGQEVYGEGDCRRLQFQLPQVVTGGSPQTQVPLDIHPGDILFVGDDINGENYIVESVSGPQALRGYRQIYWILVDRELPHCNTSFSFRKVN